MSRGTWTRRSAWIACAVLIVTTVAAGCSKERTFTASEFVGQVKDQGVDLALGQELVTNDESKKLYAISLAPLPGATPPVNGEGEAELSGSIAVYDDTGGADTGMQSCTAAGDLLCYQASNVVVILEGGGIEAQRLGVAIKKLAED